MKQPPSLETVDVQGMDIFTNPMDLRRDLHTYLQYVCDHKVKRMHRSNQISKADSLRLARLMSDPQTIQAVQEAGGSAWIDYIDSLALELNLVEYNTKGVYAGYTSNEPSFPNNYIQFNNAQYEQFLAAPLARHEMLLLQAVIGETNSCKSEFFAGDIWSRLDRFYSSGCAIGVAPQIDFVRVRRFLLELLQTCPAGVWYSTASLIQYLKEKHPYFLIPKNVRYGKGWRDPDQRYGNFMESKENVWHAEIEISESDPDAFERVEGRYVERFLEGAPLTLGYLDVAYEQPAHQDIYPSRNVLRAFRVSGRLAQALAEQIPAPQVTVQPNLEIYVESDFYPAQVLALLLPWTEIVSQGTVTILRLVKEQVAARLAENKSQDVIGLLTQLSKHELAQNVRRELSEWAAHADKFTLYQGFALLESDTPLPEDDPLIVEHISPQIGLIRSPQQVLERLHQAVQMPLHMHHRSDSLARPPQGAQTVFPQQTHQLRRKPKEKQAVTLLRRTVTTLQLFDENLFERLRKALLDQRCPVEANPSARTLTYARQYEPQIENAIKSLEKNYIIYIQDM